MEKAPDSFPLHNASYEDVLLNPKKYGIPTFEEYAKNPELMRGRMDRTLAAMEAGSSILRQVKKHRYGVFTRAGRLFWCKSLARAQELATNEGADIMQIASEGCWTVEVRQDHSTGLRLDIVFLLGGKEQKALLKFT